MIIRKKTEDPGEKDNQQKTDEANHLEQCAAFHTLQGRRMDHCAARIRAMERGSKRQRNKQKVTGAKPAYIRKNKEDDTGEG